MTYFLDTNICIFYLNGRSQAISEKIDSIALKDIKIPSVTAAELYYGASKSARREFNLERYKDFLSIFDIVNFDDSAAFIYGNIRAALETKGQLIGGNDMLIASIAMAHNAVLVTNNTKEFSRIDGITIEDWTII